MILKSLWFILDNGLVDADAGSGGSGGDNDNDNDSNDNETAAGPKVLAHVDLTKTICECSLSACIFFPLIFGA